MSTASAPLSLADLPGDLVWRGRRFNGTPPQGHPTGHGALDAVLPGGGWPTGALIELFTARPGIGELSLLLPMMRRCTADRWLGWVAPPRQPYAPALAAAGVPLERLLWVAPASPAEALWATRQCLASGGCSMVLSWLGKADMAALRRLQLAAEESRTPLFLFRPASAAQQPSPAVLRLRLEDAHGQLAVHVFKRRGPLLDEPVLIQPRPPIDARPALVAAPVPRAQVHPIRQPATAPAKQHLPVQQAAVSSTPSPTLVTHAVVRPDPARARAPGDPARIA